MSEQRPSNPYVGPRSFQETDAPLFFGRERELPDLLRMLISERIVLLYSPSGAGKTSLLRAGMVPALKKEGFRVHPIIRVTRELPGGEGDRRGNRFITSTLLSLADERGADLTASGMTADAGTSILAAHLDGMRRRAAKDVPKYDVLIFDQFEEILTTEPASRAARRERFDFFEAVAEALYDQNRWAVFSIREDYLAGLDPFRRPIPTQLSNHFRLDLLNIAGARKAIAGPPWETAKVVVDEDAVTRIVDNLSRSAAPSSPAEASPAGEGEGDGLYVEPLHLQVVCDRLWEMLRPAPDSHITADQIGDLADVDTALRAYYDDEVRRIAKESSHADERDIRDWFEEKLIISELAIRGQVPHEETSSGGLDNRAVAALVAAKLVNKETRLKNAWYELSHDRLVSPIRKSNADWYRANLEDFQRAAKTWEGRNERPSDLLGLRALMRARSRVRRRNLRLRSYERKFLDQSRSALWQRYSLYVLSVLVIVSLVIGWFLSPGESEEQILARDANAWARSAQDLLPDDQEDDLDRGLLMSAESVGQLERLQRKGEDVRIGYEETRSLFEGVVTQPHLIGPVRDAQQTGDATPEARVPQTPLGRVAVSIVALAADGRHVARWDPKTPGTVSVTEIPVISFGDGKQAGRPEDTIAPAGGTVTALAFLPLSGDDDLLAIGTSDGAVEVWGRSPRLVMERRYTLDPGRDARAGVTRLATIAGMLLAGYDNGDVLAWRIPPPEDGTVDSNRISCPELPPERQTPCGRVTGLEMSDAGRLVISYSGGVLGLVEDPGVDDRAVRLIGLPRDGDIMAVAATNDDVLVVIRTEGRLQVASFGADRVYRPLRDQPLATSTLTDVVFHPADPGVLFWGQRDGQIVTWNMNGTSEVLSPATGYAIDDLEISANGLWLASRTSDGLDQLWSTTGVSLPGHPMSGPVLSPGSCVVDVVFDGLSLSWRTVGGGVVEQDVRQRPATPIPPTVMVTDSPQGGTPWSPDPFALPRQGATPIVTAATPAGGAQPVVRVAASNVPCDVTHRLSPEALEALPDTPGPGSSSRVYGVADLDDHVRAVMYGDGTVALYRRDGDEWRLDGNLPNPVNVDVVSVALSDGGGLVALGNTDGSISLWMDDGGAWWSLGQLDGHGTPVTALRFHAKDNYLASGDESGMVIAWNLEPTEWIDFACYRAGRTFTEEEIARFLKRDPEEWKTKLVCHG